MKVLVIDTSMLCEWLGLPGMEECGPDDNRWDRHRVDDILQQEMNHHTVFALPLATLIETGNHIAHSQTRRKECADALASVIRKCADQQSPWAAFTAQLDLWTRDRLMSLAERWPEKAVQKLSLGDVTITDVAEYYHESGYDVDILTGDMQLKSYSPSPARTIPRRRQR